MAERSPTEPAEERRSVAFRAVFAVGIGLVMAAGFGAWLVYRQLLRYEPTAARHVLPGAELMVRLDVEQVVLFEPVRRHLLPLVNTPVGISKPAPGGAGPLPDRAHALREIAGLNLGRDLREIVLSKTSAGAWALALGGLFPESGVARGVETVLRREGVRALERAGEKLLLSDSGIAIGQAPGGVIVVASSRETLERALLGKEQPEQLRLPLDGHGGFAVGPAALRRWLGPAATSPALTDSGALYGRLRLERPLRLDAWLGRGDAAAANALITSAQQSLTSEAGGSARARGADSGAERALLARARVQAGPSNSPGTIVTYLELPELDSTLAWIASRVERELMPPGPEG